VTADSGHEASLTQARCYLCGADAVIAQLIDARPEQEVLAIAEKWRPYRSLATSYLFSAAFEPAEAPIAPRET
jgi:hypothetical protein